MRSLALRNDDGDALAVLSLFFLYKLCFLLLCCDLQVFAELFSVSIFFSFFFSFAYVLLFHFSFMYIKRVLWRTVVLALPVERATC